MSHIHAQSMAQYAEDAAETDRPWERWEFRSPKGGWTLHTRHPQWYEDWIYRRALQPINLTRLFGAGVDCVFSDRRYDECVEFDIGSAALSKTTDAYRPYICERTRSAWRRCWPRMDYTHIWLGGECPVPDGLAGTIYLRGGEQRKFTRSAGTYRWEHTNECDDIIAFRIDGIAYGWKWPWETQKD